jgi:hypothetical protein
MPDVGTTGDAERGRLVLCELHGGPPAMVDNCFDERSYGRCGGCPGPSRERLRRRCRAMRALSPLELRLSAVRSAAGKHVRNLGGDLGNWGAGSHLPSDGDRAGLSAGPLTWLPRGASLGGDSNRKLDSCARPHGSGQEVPSVAFRLHHGVPTLTTPFAIPAAAHGVKRLGGRIDDRVVAVRYSPCSITLR